MWSLRYSEYQTTKEKTQTKKNRSWNFFSPLTFAPLSALNKTLVAFFRVWFHQRLVYFLRTGFFFYVVVVVPAMCVCVLAVVSCSLLYEPMVRLAWEGKRSVWMRHSWRLGFEALAARWYCGCTEEEAEGKSATERSNVRLNNRRVGNIYLKNKKIKKEFGLLLFGLSRLPIGWKEMPCRVAGWLFVSSSPWPALEWSADFLPPSPAGSISL